LYRYVVSQLMSFATITICVASQRVFIVVDVYFVIDSVRKRLDTPSYGSSRVHSASDLGFSFPFFTIFTHLEAESIPSY
jgi:hypothetical protein